MGPSGESLPEEPLVATRDEEGLGGPESETERFGPNDSIGRLPSAEVSIRNFDMSGNCNDEEEG